MNQARIMQMKWVNNIIRELKQPQQWPGRRRPEVTWTSVHKHDQEISSSWSGRRRQKDKFHVVVNLKSFISQKV